MKQIEVRLKLYPRTKGAIPGGLPITFTKQNLKIGAYTEMYLHTRFFGQAPLVPFGQEKRGGTRSTVMGETRWFWVKRGGSECYSQARSLGK